MARQSRIVVADHPHHVTQRGNRRQTVFFRDEDYVLYLQLAAECFAASEAEVWGYCLMPNCRQDAGGTGRGAGRECLPTHANAC